MLAHTTLQKQFEGTDIGAAAELSKASSRGTIAATALFHPPAQRLQ